MTVLIDPVTHWYCPACKATDTTTRAQPHTRFHTCPRMRGMSVPMVRAGQKAKVELREREDYVGTDHPQIDENGRPVMAAVVTRDEGEDVAVYAGLATATGEA